MDWVHHALGRRAEEKWLLDESVLVLLWHDQAHALGKLILWCVHASVAVCLCLCNYVHALQDSVLKCTLLCMLVRVFIQVQSIPSIPLAEYIPLLKVNKAKSLNVCCKLTWFFFFFFENCRRQQALKLQPKFWDQRITFVTFLKQNFTFTLTVLHSK